MCENCYTPWGWCGTISYVVGIKEVQDAVDESAKVVERGFKTLKLKAGIEPARDVEVVKKTREAVGDRVELKVDFNQGYPGATAKDHIKVIKEMERYRLQLVEQPMPGWDLDGMAEVKRTVETPILADESVFTPRDVVRVAEKKAADAINVYVTKPGGLYNAKKVVAVAEACNMPCLLGSNLEVGVGNAANVHFAASTRNIRYACDIVGPLLHADDVIEKPEEYFVYKEGYLRPVEKPGLGVTLDDEKVKKYMVTLKMPTV